MSPISKNSVFSKGLIVFCKGWKREEERGRLHISAMSPLLSPLQFFFHAQTNTWAGRELSSSLLQWKQTGPKCRKHIHFAVCQILVPHPLCNMPNIVPMDTNILSMYSPANYVSILQFVVLVLHYWYFQSGLLPLLTYTRVWNYGKIYIENDLVSEINWNPLAIQYRFKLGKSTLLP